MFLRRVTPSVFLILITFERNEDKENRWGHSSEEHIQSRIIFLVRWTPPFNAIRGTQVSMNFACIICFD